MNLDEALGVLWLKSNPRPLGELLKEGYLTRERLEWAAQWAYNPNLKEAAKVLLASREISGEKIQIDESSQPSLKLGITLEKARSMLWPFSPYKGRPMGQLVDSQQISLKDLGYAIENAWDENIRQAAVALSLIRLEQIVTEPPPSAGFAKIISEGKSFARRKQLQLAMLDGLIFGIVFGILIVILIVQFLYDQSKPSGNSKTISELLSTPEGWVALVGVLIFFFVLNWIIFFIPNQLSKRIDKKIEEFRRGEVGEERALHIIAQALDGNWTIFRNLTIPGKNKADLDLVLVGPPGVWVIEIKNFSGEYRNVGDNWEYRNKNKWKKAFKNPSRQALNNAVRLGNFFKADNIRVFVNPTVVWTNEESRLHVDNPSVSVWQITHLVDELGNIWQGEKVSKEDRDKINRKLTKLCDPEKSTK